MENRLHDIREKKGLTVTELAKLSGLSRQYVLDIENGEANVTVKVMKALAEALNCEVTDIFLL